MNLKRICACVLFLLCFSAVATFSQDGRPIEIIDAITVETFDDENTQWTVRSSESGSDRLLNQPAALQFEAVEAWPSALFGYNPAAAGSLRVLGVRANFERRGNNYLELIPPGGSLTLPGFTKEIDLWVWNLQRNYSVTVQLQDFRGVHHTIDMGDIDHLGWARISARIPNYVLQRRQTHINIDNLRLLKLIVWTDPIERVDDFTLYFDELRVISDVYYPRIDGEDLIDRVWGDA